MFIIFGETRPYTFRPWLGDVKLRRNCYGRKMQVSAARAAMVEYCFETGVSKILCRVGLWYEHATVCHQLQHLCSRPALGWDVNSTCGTNGIKWPTTGSNVCCVFGTGHDQTLLHSCSRRFARNGSTKFHPNSILDTVIWYVEVIAATYGKRM